MKTTQTIPGFSKYVLTGDQVGPASKPEVSLKEKKGTGKFYLENDGGKRKLISLSDIKILVSKNTVSSPKPKEKAPAKKKSAPAKRTPGKAKAKGKEEETKGATLLRFKENKKVQTILKEDGSKDRKIMKLHNLGLENYQIAYLTDSTKNNVSRGIWMYEKGHRTL